MYANIVFLPFLAAILSGLFGRILGVKGVHIINVTCLLITTVLSFIAFYEVVLCNSPVSVELFSWVSLEHLNISWSFYYDELTVSMLIPVAIVSLLVHLYSVGYMSEDPHQQRFFSYISLFTGLMLVLVTGNNFLVMFVGWEGIIKCLKWHNNLINQYNIVIYILLLSLVLLYLFLLRWENKYNKISLLIIKSKFFTLSNKGSNTIKNNKKRNLTSYERIGPHNIDIISIIVGSTLGDTHLEKRENGVGTRIIFEQCSRNVEYLMWFHQYLSTRGYCNEKIPVLKKRIRKNGKIFFFYRIQSYTFSSFNWLHDMFYTFDSIENKCIKIIPSNIEEYLTPLALAIWFMDDGSKCGSSVKIATNSFTVKEILSLCEILKNKYNIISSTASEGKDKGYCLYIYKMSLPIFSSIVKPYMLPSLYYKLNGY
jgi:LAGLIDADG DNA endonuclease family/NADH-Ubiquinone oxidoreductase (complex I), chain 5 N-terminus